MSGTNYVLRHVEVAEIVVGDRHRKNLRDIKGLAESIHKNGLLEPIGINKDNTLIYGERRLEAVKTLNWQQIPAVVWDVEGLALLTFEEIENAHRHDYLLSEKVALADAIRNYVGDKRQRKQHNGKEVKSYQVDRPDTEGGDQTRDIAANGAGFTSTMAYRRARSVTEHGIPELVEAMDAGTVSLDAASEIATLKPAKQAQVLKGVREGEPVRKALSGAKPKKKKAKGEKPASPPPAAPQDSVGRTIPTCQRDVFADPAVQDARKTVDAWVDALAWFPLCKALAEGAAFLPFLKVEPFMHKLKEAEEHLTVAQRILLDGLPHVVCPKCEGEGCEECLQGGHLPEWKWTELYGEAKEV